MKITTRKIGDVTILDCSGKVTLGEGTMVMRNAVRDVLKSGGKKIILNIAEVQYIDSSGVGELVSLLNEVANKEGKFKLLNPTLKIQELLQITKLVICFEIFGDEQTALTSFGLCPQPPADNAGATGEKILLTADLLRQYQDGRFACLHVSGKTTGGLITGIEEKNGGFLIKYEKPADDFRGPKGNDLHAIQPLRYECTKFNGGLVIVDKAFNYSLMLLSPQVFD